MSKDAGEKTVTQSLDPNTQAYIQEVRDRARQVAGTPYQGNPNSTVAGADPLSYAGAQGLQDTLSRLGYLGGASGNMAEMFNQQGQTLNGMSSQFGRTADQMQGPLASGFDQLAGRMRGTADQYGGAADQMMMLGGNFDQQAQGTDALARGFDQRSAGLDALGQRFNPYIASGQAGARALGGDQGAISNLMNPYQSQVLDAVSADYDKQRALAHNQANDAAAQAGAFGGSRHAIMEGARLGELDQGQLSTMAGLRASGYENALAHAGEAANLGLGAGQMDLSGRQLGQGERAMGLDARQLGQGYNQLGLSARGLGAQFGGLGLNAEQVGQGYNGMGMDARNLGLQYDNLGLGAANAAGGMYQNALGAYGQAGQLAGAGANVAQGLLGAGDYFRNIAQQKLSDQDARFREARDWDLRNLGILGSGVTGMPYGTQTSEPLSRNVFSGIAGGAATGGAIGGPIGAGIGGIFGGLFG